MKDIEKIDAILLGMIPLLRAATIFDWAKAFQDCRKGLHSDSDKTLDIILAMYGGMGSLNDIVLFKDGVLMDAENMAFDALRTQLYQACKESRE